MKLRWIASLLVLGSAGCAYEHPAAPSANPTDLSAPFQVTLGALPGTGAQAGTATVTARVQNSNGAGLPNVLVTFSTSQGTIAPASVATGIDGSASATLVATDTANVTALAGTLSARTFVPAIAPTPPVPTPTPAPAPTPIPAPPSPLVFLNVSTSAATGVPVAFSVSSSATNATWNWSFGDGATDQTTAFSTSHTYAKAGSYTATVSASGTSAASATITVTDPPLPPPPALALAATINCTLGNHTTVRTSCNITLTYRGAALPAGQVTNVEWDWGDGTTAPAELVTTRPVMDHQYIVANTYTVYAKVTASTVDGSQTTTTTKAVVIP